MHVKVQVTHAEQDSCQLQGRKDRILPTYREYRIRLPTYEYMDVWVQVAQVWQDGRQQVDALAVHKAAECYQSDATAAALGEVWLIERGVHGCTTQQNFTTEFDERGEPIRMQDLADF